MQLPPDDAPNVEVAPPVRHADAPQLACRSIDSARVATAAIDSERAVQAGAIAGFPALFGAGRGSVLSPPCEVDMLARVLADLVDRRQQLVPQGRMMTEVRDASPGRRKGALRTPAVYRSATDQFGDRRRISRVPVPGGVGRTAANR